MNDEYVNKGKVVALATWGAVLLLMALAWVTILATPHAPIGGLFAAMACATSALAATMSVRCYAVRTACLIRAASGLGRSGDFEGPRPLRDL